MRRTALLACVAALVALSTASAAPPATAPTVRVSGPNAPGDRGASADPAISSSGRYIAYASSASDLASGDGNGTVRDVFITDLRRGQTALVSRGLDGAPADGPSSDPAISEGGGIVALTSSATNLTRRDENGVDDVFVLRSDLTVLRVSVTPVGGSADGPSSSPDVSADGRFVAFVSSADDLVPGDTNRAADVFVRDFRTQRTTRVSMTSGGLEADGPSAAPAISADGSTVSFFSRATNLTGDDSNGVGDVFVTDRLGRRTERVSVSSLETEQNRSVARPFAQLSDLSADGRSVAFDSDATNLVPGDRNRRTDVFVRDRRRGLTRLESENSRGFQGDNDSFAPSITPDGRFVAFASFATNLASVDAPGEDVFLRDVRAAKTALLDIGDLNQRREPERVRQLLQRPTLSADGRFAAFVSTASNLVGGDTDTVADVFRRTVRAPAR